MRILGIDYGKKKIGLALGESDVRVAVPLEKIENRGDETLKELAKMIKDEGIDLVVVGVPLAVQMHENKLQTHRSRTFAAKLQPLITVPIVEEDESFTTAESQRLMRDEGATADEDALAAMVILQTYLNRA